MAFVLVDVPLTSAPNFEGAAPDDDNEDPTDRNEYEVERDMGDVEEDPAIHHDVYPESENEGLAPNLVVDNFIRRGDGFLNVEQSFINGVAFKEAVVDYALRTGRNITRVRYDKTNLAYRCIGNEKCPWYIYCSVRKNSVYWKIRKFRDEHSCEPNGACDILKVPVIARMFVDNIREEPEHYMPQRIEREIQSRWELSVSRMQCQAARGKALKWIASEYEDQFRRLRDYGNEIQEANPGSTVEVGTVRMKVKKKKETGETEEGEETEETQGNEETEAADENGTDVEYEDVFHRFYVCFQPLRKAWKDYCRPILGVDGCFMKSKMKGQVLSAIGRDGYNRIYPVAWAVVAVENTENWAWFLKKLRADLGLGLGAGFVLMSDRQKGLIKVVSMELPEMEHRMCVRHIYGNIKARHGQKKENKPFILNLAWSYNQVQYEANLKKLLAFDKAVHDEVLSTKPETWCRAFHRLGSHCEDVENNFTESFNSSITKAREKPLVPMLETIRRLAMVRIARRFEKASKRVSEITPYASEVLESEKSRAAECLVRITTNGFYESGLSIHPHRVHLQNKTCTCKKWEITGIPCVHAYGVILHKKLKVEDYVSHWFHTKTWRKTYQAGIIPLRGAAFWPRGCQSVAYKTDEDKEKSRKIEKRKKGVNESPVKKKQKVLKRIMHCSVCHKAGHNSRFHKREDSEAGSQPQSSQMVLFLGGF